MHLLPAEPSAPDPTFPRYTQRPFPRYRFVPGRAPHPTRSPLGHSRGRPELEPVQIDPLAWAACEEYLWAVDLYNFAYYWESHELFEAIWHGAGRSGPVGGFAQGMVQLGAAHLKRFMGAEEGCRALLDRALLRLGGVVSPYLGVDLRRLERDTAAYFRGSQPTPALITLQMPKDRPETSEGSP